MAYVIKHLPEDFVVHELPSLQVTDKGTYTCFLLTKRNITTTDAVDMIASDLRIPSRRIGYAGLKDKHGITSQVCTIEGEFSQALRQTKISDLTIELLGHADRPASLGILAVNHFTITVRNIETAPDLSSPASMHIAPLMGACLAMNAQPMDLSMRCRAYHRASSPSISTAINLGSSMKRYE